MVKKKIVAKPVKSICDHPRGKGCLVLLGLVIIALGVASYMNYLALAKVFGALLIIVGLKKVFIAAKCC